jgi:hypothetical protein
MVNKPKRGAAHTMQSGFVRHRSRFFAVAVIIVTLLVGLFVRKLAADEPDSAGSKTYKGRVIAPVMSYQGAGWLERSDRESTEQPEKVLDVLNIRAGSTVADIGAGTGYFSLRLAKRVGPSGRVLATESHKCSTFSKTTCARLASQISTPS